MNKKKVYLYRPFFIQYVFILLLEVDQKKKKNFYLIKELRCDFFFLFKKKKYKNMVISS
jgi:hypothetical protein